LGENNAVGAAAIATGRPVFLCYDYFQQQTYTGKRSPFFMNVKFAADKKGMLQGMLQGMETEWSVDHGPYSEFGDLLTLRGAQFIDMRDTISKTSVVKVEPCAPTTPGALLSGATAHPSQNSPPKYLSTNWPKNWVWIRWNCAIRTVIVKDRPHQRVRIQRYIHCPK
jgi:CO/xanthine dehydrogenase Mo-binding subunit